MKKTIMISLVLGSACAFAAQQFSQGAETIAAKANQTVKAVKDGAEQLVGKIEKSTTKMANKDTSNTATKK
jgi:hypothetical protein